MPTNDDIDNQISRILHRVTEAGGTVTPSVNPYARNGYEYAMGALDDRHLATLAHQGYLDQRFVDRVNLCPKCLGHHLNLREVCPACRWSNLSDEIILHHFRCGYVGRLAEFNTADGERVCPKCARRMSHIGTEYDRLGKTFRCNACGLSFQDPPVDALCLSCGTNTPAEGLSAVDVFSYTLNSRGRAALLHTGTPEAPKESSLVGEFPIYRQNVIRAFLEQEAKRSEFFNTPFCVLLLDVIESAAATLGEYGTLRLVSGLRNRLRNVDLIGQFSARQFVVVLPQTASEEAERVRQSLLETQGLQQYFTISSEEIRELQDVTRVLATDCSPKPSGSSWIE